MSIQTRLFSVEPRLASLSHNVEHVELAPGSWLEVRRGWLQGDDQLFDHLESTTQWHAGRRQMYDRMVDVPRLTAAVPRDGPGHPVLAEAVAVLSERYGRPVDRVSLALYRNGSDSVAFHGDRLGKQRCDAVVAILSLRGPRRLRIRPRGGNAGVSGWWDIGFGDLLVMGGRCQEDFEHGVAKVASASARMSVMFRSAGVTP